MALWRNIEDSAPFLRVSLLIFDVRRFLEEDPNLPVNFFSLSLSARAAEVFLPYNIISGLRSSCEVVDIHPLVWRRSFRALRDSRPLSSLRDRDSKVLGGNASRLRAILWEVLYLPSVFLVS